MKKLSNEAFRRILNIAYLTAVAVILLLPPLTMNLKRDLNVDNRPAEKFPVWSVDGFTGFPRQFELWFGDRFGGRKDFISWGNWILYQCFHESPSEQILPGRDGFIFFASHTNGDANRNALIKRLFNYNDQMVSKDATGFERHMNEFSNSRTRVLFMSVPTKHFLYFDKMPDSIKAAISDPNHLISEAVEQEIIRRHPEAAKFIIPLRSEAVKASRKVGLIPPCNFHWIPGPYTHLAASITAEHLGVVEQMIDLESDNYRAVKIKSDLRRFMYRGLKSPALITNDEDFEAMGIHTSRGLPPGLQNKVSLSSDMNSLFYYANNPDAPGGRILLFGDSFTNPLCQDMARYFREVISVEYSALCRIDKRNALNCLKQITAAYSPEYIVVVSHVSATVWAGEAAALLESLQVSPR